MLLSHLNNKETEQFIKGCFDDRGRALVAIKEPGASLYLYELYEPLTTIKETTINYFFKYDSKDLVVVNEGSSV